MSALLAGVRANAEGGGMTELVKYNAARQALAEAHRVDEVKDIHDKAVAMQAYAKQAKDTELIGYATEIRLRAERRAGEILVEMEKHRGGRPTKTGSHEEPVLRLSDLDISKSQSSKWQRLAELPDDEFETKVERGKRKAVSVIDGTAKLERAEMRAQDEERVRSLSPAQGKFRTLIIDPPWDYEWLSLAGRARPGYATMTHEELLAMDVAQWADDNCHLYLWTTNNFMTRAVDLMAHWGFQHKTVLTWVKPRWGFGSYFRNSTEHVLFGVRGELRTRSDSIATHFEAPTTDHSAKPDAFYDLVLKASYEPFGEAFQRTSRPEFTNLFEEKAAA